jgi:decaprenyl-phosphate phosphoribosyltransferase
MVPLAAHEATDLTILARTTVVFVVFCTAASLVYVINDVRDRELDAAHATKCKRPIASGDLSRRAALGFAAVLLALLVIVASVTQSPSLGVVVAIYVILQLAYAVALKHIPVIDIAVIATGFVLRPVAASAYLDIALSPWFLIVVGAFALVVASAKRLSELRLSKTGGGRTRPVLAQYTESYLFGICLIGSSVAIMGYALWSFSASANAWDRSSWTLLLFVLVVLRFLFLCGSPTVLEEPEKSVYKDATLGVLVFAWFLVYALIVTL